jgi:hypothetical protein
MIPVNECNVSGIADMRDGLDERLENRSFEWSKAFWTLQEIGGSDATETSCGATRAEVVLCSVFSTSKSFGITESTKREIPIKRNIRARTSKLHHSRFQQL